MRGPQVGRSLRWRAKREIGLASVAEAHARFTNPGAYVTLLSEDPRALVRLVWVVSASAFVGDAVVGRPELTDIALFGRDDPLKREPEPEPERERERERVQLSAGVASPPRSPHT